jgi:hypothetical protein
LKEKKKVKSKLRRFTIESLFDILFFFDGSEELLAHLEGVGATEARLAHDEAGGRRVKLVTFAG